MREELPVHRHRERLAQHGEVVVHRLGLEAVGELLRLVRLDVAHPDLVEPKAPECGNEMVLEGRLLGGQRRVLVVVRRVHAEEVFGERGEPWRFLPLLSGPVEPKAPQKARPGWRVPGGRLPPRLRKGVYPAYLAKRADDRAEVPLPRLRPGYLHPDRAIS